MTHTHLVELSNLANTFKLPFLYLLEERKKKEKRKEKLLREEGVGQ